MTGWGGPYGLACDKSERRGTCWACVLYSNVQTAFFASVHLGQLTLWGSRRTTRMGASSVVPRMTGWGRGAPGWGRGAPYGLVCERQRQGTCWGRVLDRKWWKWTESRWHFILEFNSVNLLLGDEGELSCQDSPPTSEWLEGEGLLWGWAVTKWENMLNWVIHPYISFFSPFRQTYYMMNLELGYYPKRSGPGFWHWVSL